MLQPLILDLPTPEATDRLAKVLAAHLTTGDAVLLQGPIGAGKSHLARALIRERLGNPQEDVPSPTFTLVQTYPGLPAIWHADLYRLTHPDEVLELGLDEAFGSAITLVEWPDRLGSDQPSNPIQIALGLNGEGRRAEIAMTGRPALATALRALAADLFLDRHGWGTALRQTIAGDASGRRFERLNRAGHSAIFLDNPPGLPDRLDNFLRIDRHLRAIGLGAPEILSDDVVTGFAVMEDLGSDLFSTHLAAHPEDELRLYTLATDVLIALQTHPAPLGLTDLTAEAWAEAAMLSVTQYRAALSDQPADPAPLARALAAALHRHGDGPRVLVHRDYFAGNLMLVARGGLQAVGLIDFQLAQMGQPVYDLVSLLQDARRDVSPAVQATLMARFAAATNAGPGFDAAFAVWGAQRALRILGVFARLCRAEGRAEYLAYLPRVMGDLRRNLAHPALTELAALCTALLPEPTPEALQRLRSQCGAFR